MDFGRDHCHPDREANVGDLLWQLIPIALFGAASPLPITVVVTLLMSERGVAKAIAFGGGLIGVLAVIGVFTLSRSSDSDASSSTQSTVVGTIIAALGVLLVLMAVKLIVNAPDPDAPPPKFMTSLTTISAGRAAGFGAILALINFKQLGIFIGGVAEIVEAEVSGTQQWIALIVLLVVLQLGVIAPIVVYVVARDWATRQLVRFQEWLARHNRAIGIVLGLVIGILFIVEGVSIIR